jgi:hypothetical protein
MRWYRDRTMPSVKVLSLIFIAAVVGLVAVRVAERVTESESEKALGVERAKVHKPTANKPENPAVLRNLVVKVQNNLRSLSEAYVRCVQIVGDREECLNRELLVRFYGTEQEHRTLMALPLVASRSLGAMPTLKRDWPGTRQGTLPRLAQYGIQANAPTIHSGQIYRRPFLAVATIMRPCGTMSQCVDSISLEGAVGQSGRGTYCALEDCAWLDFQRWHTGQWGWVSSGTPAPPELKLDYRL